MRTPKPANGSKSVKRRVYKPTTQTKPGQIGLEPGTVDWELMRRRERRLDREAERSWAEREHPQDDWWWSEPKYLLLKPLYAVLRWRDSFFS